MEKSTEGKQGKDLSVLCSINEEVKMDEAELGLCQKHFQLLPPSLPPSFKCPVLLNAALFVMAETINNLDVYQWEMLR